MTGTVRRRRLVACVLAAASAGAVLPGSAEAQDFKLWDAHEGRITRPMREGLPEYRGGFMLCRLLYTSVRSEPEGLGWSTDYPRGDQNLLVRLSQLTAVDLARWADGTPGHAVVRATDPDLFRCPFLFTSDVGTVGFEPEEVVRLREYLLKGGLLWVDDFWGDAAWQQWTAEIGRVLPEYEVVELTPDHPIFTTLYQVDHLPQIPNIGFWRRTNGETAERGEESPHARLGAIFDERGRLLVIMTHNTDIADGWEREGESNEFFTLFSPRAYGIAVNIAVWMMTR